MLKNFYIGNFELPPGAITGGTFAEIPQKTSEVIPAESVVDTFGEVCAEFPK